MAAELIASMRKFEEDAKAQTAEVERLRLQLEEEKRIHQAQLEKERQENKYQMQLEKSRLEQELADMRSAFELERKAWEIEKAQVSKVKVELPSVVKLNVQGTMFATSKSTLESEPQSILALLASGKHLSNAEQPGDFHDGSTLFIDRDPDIFKFIMNWLVYCKSNQEMEYASVFNDLTRTQMVQLKLEAQHFRLTKLCEVLGVDNGNNGEDDEKKAPAAVGLKRLKPRNLHSLKKLSQEYVDSLLWDDAKSRNFRRRDVSQLIFAGASLNYTYFIDCRAVQADFAGCTFDGVDFSGSEFSGADFMQARFSKCDFTQVDLTNDFCGATFQECKFSSSWLESPNFVNVTFSRCTFEGLTDGNGFSFNVEDSNENTIKLDDSVPSQAESGCLYQIASRAIKATFRVDAGLVDQELNFQKTVQLAECSINYNRPGYTQHWTTWSTNSMQPCVVTLKIPKSIPSHLRCWKIMKV
eukprot:TRINITY_DN1155_c0_g1_i3.p1 TRINITY_DN1155_c0_g1~~TRINITY_DN1155_c0_g1_i3.p1  ORF type:complete len:470 (+),score=115.37 TRINITY_DN1155_c0_g1_i3:95-1504(+)